MDTIEIPVGMDAHLHVRDGDRLSVVNWSAKQFGYAIIMPNLAPKHVTTIAEANAYRTRIMNTLDRRHDFEPLMTLSLTSDSTKEDLTAIKDSPYVHAVKLYAGLTTNSKGVSDVRAFNWAFEILEKTGVPLLLHGEVGAQVDVFDRESMFYQESAPWIVNTFPELKVVCEHITTRVAVNFVKQAQNNVVATITPQHLLSNRNDMLGAGMRPDMYCFPILKREEDRDALLGAATSGSSKFFLGTDSAPHPQHGEAGKAKYSSCGCAGCFSAPYALELYATAFDSVNKLHALQRFASTSALAFYGLDPKPGTITIERVEVWEPSTPFFFGKEDTVAPYMPFSHLEWEVTRSM